MAVGRPESIEAGPPHPDLGGLGGQVAMARTPRGSVDDVGPVLEVGRVLGRTFRVWARNLLPFTVLAGLAFSPLFLYVGKRLVLPAWRGRPGGVEAAIDVLPALLLGGPLLVFVAAGFLAHGTVQSLRGRRPSFAASLMVALRRLPALVAIVVLLAVALFLWTIPGSVAMRIVGGMYWEDFRSALALGMVFAVATLVPPLLSVVRLSVAVPVVAVEGRNGFAAFERSRVLTKGSRWRVFAVFLVLVLIHGLGLTVLGYVLPAWEPRLWAELGYSTLVTGALLAVASAVVYEDRRVAKDGADPEDLARVFE